MSLSKEKLQKLIEFYKKSFVEHWSEEKYKWQAIKHLYHANQILTTFNCRSNTIFSVVRSQENSRN